MYSAAVIGIAIADRFLLRRNQIKINTVAMIENDDVIRFTVDYATKKSIKDGMIYYTIKNKKKPTTIISHRRPLIFSDEHNNQEIFSFHKKSIEDESGEFINGNWIVSVTIERYCSWINPLYKIFPTTSTMQKEFNLE